MHHPSSENVKGAYGRVAYCCPIEKPSQWFTHIRDDLLVQEPA